MHDFAQSLAVSHAASDLPIWEAIYREAFPGYAAMVDHRANGEHQRAGIDRSVILANSKQVLVDEKVRGRNKKTGRVYEDIALEYVSNSARGVAGWVCKPLRADYIAYAIAPLGRGYLLPVLPLQVAWDRCGDHWISMYPKIIAQNNGYTTISVGVPVADVFKEMGGALRVRFQPFELEEAA